MSESVSFVYWGMVPSKSNYRWSRTPEAKKRWAKIKHFEEELAIMAQHAWGRGSMLKMPPPVTVEMVPYNQRQDANNLAKIVLDSLEGTAYTNDRDVGCFIHPMHRDKKGARIYVTVRWGS